MARSCIHLNHVCYSIAGTAVQFKDLCLTFSQKRVGIVGDNGIGKTTLLKVLAGELLPQSGRVECSGSFTYCPQQFNAEGTVAEVLQVQSILQVLARIEQGSVSENDFALADGQWDLRSRIDELFASHGLQNVALEQPFATLSGGERIRAGLACVLSQTPAPQLLLLDEPTNHLDIKSQLEVTRILQAYQGAMLVVSHDRVFLSSLHLRCIQMD